MNYCEKFYFSLIIIKFEQYLKTADEGWLDDVVLKGILESSYLQEKIEVYGLRDTIEALVDELKEYLSEQ